MPTVTIPADPAVKDPTEALLPAAVNLALANLNANTVVLAGAGVSNGSFEFDLETPGEPDSWLVTDNSGGTHQLSAIEANGAQSLRMNTTAGGGWVQAVSLDYILCQPGERIQVEAAIRQSSATAVRTRVQLLFYDSGKTLISTVDVIDYANIPAAFRKYTGPLRQYAIPSGSARFYRVKLIAGESGGSVAASVFFDNIRTFVYHGSVPLASTSKGTFTSGTNTIDVSGEIGDDERATFVQVSTVFNVDSGTIVAEVQGWVGGAWATIGSNNPSLGLALGTVIVPLDDDNQFRVVVSGAGGTDSVTVSVTGKYEV